MPRVLNRKTDHIGRDAVYVGRPTKFGNPWRVGTDLRTGRPIDRAEAIERYRTFLMNNSYLLAAARTELKGKDLVCWCAPLSCHADVLLEIANGG
jgi:hypothetical protein